MTRPRLMDIREEVLQRAIDLATAPEPEPFEAATILVERWFDAESNAEVLRELLYDLSKPSLIPISKFQILRGYLALEAINQSGDQQMFSYLIEVCANWGAPDDVDYGEWLKEKITELLDVVRSALKTQSSLLVERCAMIAQLEPTSPITAIKVLESELINRTLTELELH
ncbi:MAG: hypothetical protein AAGG51_05055 [Cyanobacteria bacterium P01_G01_bin.54]